MDFYLYLNNSKNNYIIDKHNWLGNINDNRFSLHFPKKIIFPIIKDGQFNFPQKP